MPRYITKGTSHSLLFGFWYLYGILTQRIPLTLLFFFCFFFCVSRFEIILFLRKYKQINSIDHPIFYLLGMCQLGRCRYANCRPPIAGSWNTRVCLRAFSTRLAVRTFAGAVAIALRPARTYLLVWNGCGTSVNSADQHTKYHKYRIQTVSCAAIRPSPCPGHVREGWDR